MPYAQYLNKKNKKSEGSHVFHVSTKRVKKKKEMAIRRREPHYKATRTLDVEIDQGNSPEMNVAKMAGRNVNGVTKDFIGLLRRYDEPLTFKQRMAFSGKDLTHVRRKRDLLLSKVRHKMVAHMYEMGGINVEHYFERRDHGEHTLSYDEFVHAARKSCELDEIDAITLIKAVDKSKHGHIRFEDLKSFLMIPKSSDSKLHSRAVNTAVPMSSSSSDVQTRENDYHQTSSKNEDKQAHRIRELEAIIQDMTRDLRNSIEQSDEIRRLKKNYSDLHGRYSSKNEELLECRRELDRAKKRISELTETIAVLRKKSKQDEVTTTKTRNLLERNGELDRAKKKSKQDEVTTTTTSNRFVPSQEFRTTDLTKRIEALRNSEEKLEARESPPSLSRVRSWHSWRSVKSPTVEQEKVVTTPVTTSTSPPLSRIRPWRSHRPRREISNTSTREEKEKWNQQQNPPVLGDTIWRRLSWWPTSHHAAHNTAFQKIVLGRRKSYGGTPL